MTSPQDAKQFLTLDQAYIATWSFIHQFYERDEQKSESLFSLLTWMELDDARESSDPMQWHDWVRAVDQALARGNDVFSDPVSPPRTS
jgi:hypothetical protein